MLLFQSDPIYVPVKFEDKHSSSGNESDEGSTLSSRSVRFNNLSEVRQLSGNMSLLS